MIFSKSKLKKFTGLLDRTAEKDPLLWLPCVLLLTVILGAEKLFGAVGAAASRLKAVSEKSEKPLLRRVTACAAAAAFALCILPKSAQISVSADNEQDGAAVSEEDTDIGKDGEESGTEAPAETEGESTEGTEEKPAEQAKDTARTSGVKNGISIALECDVENISKGTAHISTRREFFNSSAVLKIMSSEAADEAAGGVMSKLGDMSGYYEFYPFDMNLSDAESGDEVKLMNDGFITVEMPVPKKMLRTPEQIKVYHIKDGMPEAIESELVTAEGANPTVRFNVKEFSPYIFVTPSYYEDVSSAAGSYDGSAPAETAAIPSTGGVTLPNVYGDLPRNLKFTGKKRRYRVVKKRNLDDMVFVY